MKFNKTLVLSKFIFLTIFMTGEKIYSSDTLVQKHKKQAESSRSSSPEPQSIVIPQLDPTRLAEEAAKKIQEGTDTQAAIHEAITLAIQNCMQMNTVVNAMALRQNSYQSGQITAKIRSVETKIKEIESGFKELAQVKGGQEEISKVLQTVLKNIFELNQMKGGVEQIQKLANQWIPGLVGVVYKHETEIKQLKEQQELSSFLVFLKNTLPTVWNKISSFAYDNSLIIFASLFTAWILLKSSTSAGLYLPFGGILTKPLAICEKLAFFASIIPLFLSVYKLAKAITVYTFEKLYSFLDYIEKITRIDKKYLIMGALVGIMCRFFAANKNEIANFLKNRRLSGYKL